MKVAYTIIVKNAKVVESSSHHCRVAALNDIQIKTEKGSLLTVLKI